MLIVVVSAMLIPEKEDIFSAVVVFLVRNFIPKTK